MNPIKWLAAGASAAAATYAAYVGTTWLRYGKPRRRTANEDDALLLTFMPEYEICERHSIHVDAPASVTLATAKSLELTDSRIIRAIFWGRERILRSAPVVDRPRGLFAGMQTIGWGVLAEADYEIVFGAVTKPWEPNPVFRALPPEEFAAFAEPDYVKIVWTLRADVEPDGTSTFRTETRAIATDPGARAKFRLYWSLLSPGILIIREAMMPTLKAAAERTWSLPGDELVAGPQAQMTHAITIAAPPAAVWPWLVQMGGQRAGWYSWDALDNGGKRSADRIIPSLQQLEVGDVLPYRPQGTDGFEVLRLEPERALVLGSSTPDFHGTWAFVLEPVGEEATRLVTRYRAAFEPGPKMALMKPWMIALHAFMERKQLRTLKDRAEHMH